MHITPSQRSINITLAVYCVMWCINSHLTECHQQRDGDDERGRHLRMGETTVSTKHSAKTVSPLLLRRSLSRLEEIAWAKLVTFSLKFDKIALVMGNLFLLVTVLEFSGFS